MKQLRWFSFLNTIAGQLLMLLFLAMALFFISFYATVRVANDNINSPPVSMFSERQFGLAEILSRMPAEERAENVAFIQKNHPETNYELLPKDTALPEGVTWNGFMRRDWGTAPPPKPSGSTLDFFRDPPDEARPPYDEGTPPQPRGMPPTALASIDQARYLDPVGKNAAEATVYYRFEDGQIFAVTRYIMLNPPADFMITMISGFMITCMTLLMIWAYFLLVRPIRKLARVTDTIAKDTAEPQPVEIAGPGELRTASRALNKMQDRIHHLIEDRTRMLAAVGHDLRTPVTRLRLRVDVVEPEDVKSALLRDINMMDGLLSRLMTYFSKGNTGEELKPFELSSLIDSVIDEWSDAGHEILLVQNETCRVMARPNELLRMIDNLVDNAIKYANACSLRLVRQDEVACLEIIDHGPGIPDKDKLVLQEPFARGDEARTMNDKSGFGLGLAIARQAVVNHNAEMILLDTAGGGLTVQVRFPLVKKS